MLVDYTHQAMVVNICLVVPMYDCALTFPFFFKKFLFQKI